MTHRLMLDHPGVVRRAVILDILPTLHTFETVDKDFVSEFAGSLYAAS